MSYWKIPLYTDNPEKKNCYKKHASDLFFFYFYYYNYSIGRVDTVIHVFLNYDGIHVDTAVGCVLICFTILCLIFVIDGAGNCIIPSAAYHISCKITVKQLVDSHKYDDALQCLVGLCVACRRTPELFWRVI